MTTTAPRRAGFTLLELLVVISIIAVLISMLFGVLRLLNNQKNKVITTKLMNDISVAMTDYLATYPILGDVKDATSSDFVDSPWTFLGKRRLADGKMPYLDLLPKFLATGPAAGPWDKAQSQRDGDQIVDAWNMADHSNRLIWAVTNGQSGGAGPYTYTDEIWMRSTAGTPEPMNDIILHFSLKSGAWRKMPYAEAIHVKTLPIQFGLGAPVAPLTDD